MKLDSYYHGLETPRLMFRRLRLDDREAWQAFYRNNPNLEFLGMDTNRSVDVMADAWIRHQLERYAAGAFGQLAVVKKSDGVLIGTAGFKWNDFEYAGELPLAAAMNLIPQYWGEGYGKEAYIGLFNAVFENGWPGAIYAFRHHENHASGYLLRSLGLRDQETIELHGRLTTVAWITRETWLSLHELYYPAPTPGTRPAAPESLSGSNSVFDWCRRHRG